MPGPGRQERGAELLTVGMEREDLQLLRSCLGEDAPLSNANCAYHEAIRRIRDERFHTILVCMDHDTDQALSIAHILHQQKPELELIAYSRQHPAPAVREAVLAGYGLYCVLPGEGETLGRVLRSGGRVTPQATQRGAVTALVGARGGAGTTSLSILLAQGLAGLHRTALLDWDFHLGDLGLALDVEPPGDVLQVARQLRMGPLDAARLSREMAPLAGGLQVLPQPLEIPHDSVSEGLLSELIQCVAIAYHHTLLDCGARLGTEQDVALRAADQILLVTTPDIAGVKNAWRRLRYLERRGLSQRVRVIINTSRPREQMALADIRELLGGASPFWVHEDRSMDRRWVEAGWSWGGLSRKLRADLSSLLDALLDAPEVSG